MQQATASKALPVIVYDYTLCDYVCSLHVTIMCIHIYIYMFFPKQGLSHWSQVSHKDNTSHHRVRELLPSFLPQAPARGPSRPELTHPGWSRLSLWTMDSISTGSPPCAKPIRIGPPESDTYVYIYMYVIMELTGLPNFPTKSVCVCVCVRPEHISSRMRGHHTR